MSIPGFKLRVETMGKMMGREGFVPYQMWSDRFGEEGNLAPTVKHCLTEEHYR